MVLFSILLINTILGKFVEKGSIELNEKQRKPDKSIKQFE